MIKGTVSRDYLIKYSLLVSVDICDMAAEFHAVSVQVAVLNIRGLQNKISVDWIFITKALQDKNTSTKKYRK